MLETGFAVTAFLAVILNLLLPEEIEDEETPELTANVADDARDEEEWQRIERKEKNLERGKEPSIESSSAQPV